MKKLLSLLLVLIISLLFIECKKYPGYGGEHPDLFTVAIHNILGTVGYFQDEIRGDSRLKVIEKDNYGRVLFGYSEDNWINKANIVIMQKSDEQYAYYYPDYCFISAYNKSMWMWSDDFLEKLLLNFTDAQISNLKALNDWGKPIDNNKLEKVKISRLKEKGPIDNKDVLGQVKKIIPELYNEHLINYHKEDDFGRSIYSIYHSYEYDSRDIIVYLIMLDPYGVLIPNVLITIQDNYQYQDQLKEFKDSNNWNKPLDL